MGLSDPVGNTVQLPDLQPYTNYRMEIRRRSVLYNGRSLNYEVFVALNFSTSSE